MCEELWERWKRDESISDIGRALNKAPASILTIVRGAGGPPPARSRRRDALSMAEREKISRGLHADDNIRLIAARLGRFPSSIGRARPERKGKRVPPNRRNLQACTATPNPCSVLES